MTNLVFDTNFFGWLNKVDENCNMVEFLHDVYKTKNGIADLPQLKQMDYCTFLPEKLAHHEITDEKVSTFISCYKGKLDLNRIAKDPADLKLIVFVKENELSVFLTCEFNLLRLSNELGLKHWCMKASIHQLSESIGGIFGENEYKTEQMFIEEGSDPFFHYAKDSRCSQCHDNCPTHKSPPNLKT